MRREKDLQHHRATTDTSPPDGVAGAPGRWSPSWRRRGPPRNCGSAPQTRLQHAITRAQSTRSTRDLLRTRTHFVQLIFLQFRPSSMRRTCQRCSRNTPSPLLPSLPQQRQGGRKFTSRASDLFGVKCQARRKLRQCGKEGAVRPPRAPFSLSLLPFLVAKRLKEEQLLLPRSSAV